MSSARNLQYRRAAVRAGLRYVTDGVAGIHRKRSGKGWSYIAPRGGVIRDRDLRRRIDALAIPPAWTDVWICPDPDGHIQATARDGRGRKQYRYHPSYREARDRSKFRRMIAFSETLPLLRERLEHDLGAAPLTRKQVLAAVVLQLDRTLIRVGNDEYARENRHYGLTTLRRRHVHVKGAELQFAFRGKSGVEHCVSVSDPRIARIVQRCRDLAGEEMFQYLDAFGKRQTVSSEDVNSYLRAVTGRDITAKDFRTWGGTMLAAVELRAMGTASSRREADRNILRAIDAVAVRLGNTRTVCRKYYVHPALLEAYHLGRTVPASPHPRMRPHRRERPAAALRRDEVAVLRFLHEIVPDDGPAPAAPLRGE